MFRSSLASTTTMSNNIGGDVNKHGGWTKQHKSRWSNLAISNWSLLVCEEIWNHLQFLWEVLAARVEIMLTDNLDNLLHPLYRFVSRLYLRPLVTNKYYQFQYYHYHYYHYYYYYYFHSVFATQQVLLADIFSLSDPQCPVDNICSDSISVCECVLVSVTWDKHTFWRFFFVLHDASAVIVTN